MARVRRLLLLGAVLSTVVAAAMVTDWIVMSRHDTFIPLGGRWFIAGHPDRWEFNMDIGGWSWFAPPGRDGAFFFDGLNATLTLERHYSPLSIYPSIWAERTVGSVRIRSVLLTSLMCPIAWIVVTLSARRRRVSRGFPVGTLPTIAADRPRQPRLG